MHYDIIGDIHGHADALERLLKKMGYERPAHSHFRHPERKAVFVGDYIDCGRHSREVVEIVRSMEQNGAAIAIMGNHEYNALCYHTPAKNGGFLREHSKKNRGQHVMTLKSFNNDDGLFSEVLGWFQGLPVFYENEHFRAVHACWDESSIRYFEDRFKGNKLPQWALEESVDKSSPLYDAIENVLKGPELPLHAGAVFLDEYKNWRHQVRSKWWVDPAGKKYRDVALSVDKGNAFLDAVIPDECTEKAIVYKAGDKPVFFGHYWLKGEPIIQTPNVCCVDYSIAKGGKLVAYRYNGEDILDNNSIIS